MLPLHAAINREPREYHDRNRVWHVATNTRGCELVRDGACRYRVGSTDMSVPNGHDEASARAAGLVGQGPALEPDIKFDFATFEVIQAMRSRQGLGWTEWQAQAFADFLPQGALTAIRR